MTLTVARLGRAGMQGVAADGRSRVSRRGLPITVSLLFSALVAPTLAYAQRVSPHIGFLYPAGAERGTATSIFVGGQGLNGANEAIVSGGGGLTVKVTAYERPLTQKELNDLREKAQQLQDKRAASMSNKPDKPVFTREDMKALLEIRDKIAKRPTRIQTPALGETVTLEIKLAPDAVVGPREIRLRTPAGLSNPMLFQVGDLPEFREPAVLATTNPIPRPGRENDSRTGRPKVGEFPVKLPTVINGQILPGEVDRYRFTGTKGQRLTIAVNARALIPYLADAVPGWFQATLALYDMKGKELAYDDDFRFNPDPVIAFDVPADGDYVLEIKDAIFRGREDFVYRIAIGELPFITGIYPLGCAAAQETTFELQGWNLPATKARLDTTSKILGSLSVAVPGRNGQMSNRVSFAVDSLPETTDSGTNHSLANAQPLTLPVIVNGRIERASTADIYRFDAKAGAEIIAEVIARRLGSPLDSTLTITDASGKQLAFNDDSDDKGAGLLTHQADSRISFKAPQDGTYYVQIADAQQQGGPEFAYRLRLSPPKPDFELRMTPSSINARAGGSVPLTVYALRHDGFDGEINIALRDGPRGIYLNGARIPPHQDKVTFTLTAPSFEDDIFDLSFVGVATINGQRVGHTATPADDMMQAFAYHHLVTSREMKGCVVGRGAPLRPIGKLPLQLKPGGTTKLQISVPAPKFVGEVHLEIADAPDGITLKATPSFRGDVLNVEFTCDASKVKPGMAGNLILNASAERNNPKLPKNAARQRQPLGTVAAIPFEVVGARVDPPAAQ